MKPEIARDAGTMGGRVFGLAAAALLFSMAAAHATPPPPPGGHNPIYFGGSNAGGYPALSPSAVPAPVDERSALEITSAPNPFTKTTVFHFTLRASEAARVRIYSAAGREVRELSPAAQASGPQSLLWDGRDAQGRRLPSGVYLYRIEAGSRSASGKLVYLE